MISKEHFMKHAETESREYIKEEVRLFPREEALQTKLQNTVNWTSYREETLLDVLHRRNHTFHNREELAAI